MRLPAEGARAASRRADTGTKGIKMIRSLKTLGLAAVAALAMSAMLASAAQAETPAFFKGGETPSTWADTTIHGEQYGTVEDNFFEAFGVRLTCENEGVTFTGTIPGGTAKELTVEPHYEGCVAAGVLPVTVTMNGCDYIFTQPTKIGTDEYTGKADLTCPTGEAIEVHIYFPEDVNHEGTPFCTVNVFPAADTTGGGHVTDHLGGHIIYKNIPGDPDDVTVNATPDGISASRSGPGCPAAEENEGIYRNLVTVTGTEDEGPHTEPHDVWIEEEEEE